MLHYSFRNQSLKLNKGLWKCNKCKQLHDFTAIFFFSHPTFQEAERTPHPASSNSHLPINPGSLPPIWDPQFGRIILPVWDRKGCLSFFFFALCIAFMPLMAMNSRVTELPLPLAFCPQFSLVNALYLMILTRLSHKSCWSSRKSWNTCRHNCKKEGRKGGRREGRGGGHSIYQNKTFSLFHFSHSTERQVDCISLFK